MNRLEASLQRIATLSANGTHPLPEVRALASAKLSNLLKSSNVTGVIGGGLHEYLLQIEDECTNIGEVLSAEYLRFE
jgi:uncharacterized alpha-E superfamily protein